MKELQRDELYIETLDNAAPYPLFECMVRVTHLPTGLRAGARGRSVLKAREEALRHLTEMVFPSEETIASLVAACPKRASWEDAEDEK